MSRNNEAVRPARGNTAYQTQLRVHITRLAVLVLVSASSGAGLALLSVAAVRMIGGAT